MRTGAAGRRFGISGSHRDGFGEDASIQFSTQLIAQQERAASKRNEVGQHVASYRSSSVVRVPSKSKVFPMKCGSELKSCFQTR